MSGWYQPAVGLVSQSLLSIDNERIHNSVE
ncbi:MAG: hypothetical protein ACI955_000640 [Zhongshania sp.]|jgi:hypothetical protein